ncbi:hypothetical protein Tco_0009301, partial [Tanacetum coccineum]
FNTTAGNPVKKILLKLNLSDHRLFKDGGGDFRYSDTTHLSQSVEVLKLKNFKKDATLKLSKSTNQERYEHVGPEVASSQNGKFQDERRDCGLDDDLSMLKIHNVKYKFKDKAHPEINDPTTKIFTRESKRTSKT